MQKGKYTYEKYDIAYGNTETIFEKNRVNKKILESEVEKDKTN